MSKMYCCRPSEILNINDEYTAYCFDEACMFIRAKLESGEKPQYKVFRDEEEMHFGKFSDLYKTIK